MSIEEVSAEQFAQLFHNYHQTLLKECGTTDASTSDTWADVPAEEKDRMITATRLALLEVELAPSRHEPRRYFAKPGEAEWGC